MATAPAILALDGGDPRLRGGRGVEEKGDSWVLDAGAHEYIKPQQRKLHDSSVRFEEYNYYAEKTRAQEDLGAGGEGRTTLLSVLFPTKSGNGAERAIAENPVAENVNLSNPTRRATITEEEWTNASRALRTATASAMFYLITTDILGPFFLPYAFASMGWGPGVALFTVFGAMAGYSGYLLWQIFMGMDSYEFPLKSYGDMAFRLYGSWLRYIINFLQSIQLILIVGLNLISNGLALSQTAQFKLCYAICCLVWACAGFVLGQVRTLQKFGWLANAAVWINITCMAVTMGAAAHTSPNYAAAGLSAGYGLDPALVTPNANGVYPPVQTSGGLPHSPSFAGTVNGAMQAVFAFAGCMIFPEFMSEMRRPRDFLKGMWAAQLFIYLVYMVYGLFMYGFQGQYVTSPSYLGVSRYSLQTAGNALAMTSTLIATALYGNIGIKVLYNNIFVEIFQAPMLTTRAGKIAWVAMVPIYWTVAFVIAAGIPDFSGLTGVIAATCLLQFTFTFPPLLSIAYMIKKNAIQAEAGEGFDPTTGHIVRHDVGFRRMLRGFTAGRWYQNVFNVLYVLGALAMAGLGTYGAIENLIGAFANGAANSFVCRSPLEG